MAAVLLCSTVELARVGLTMEELTRHREAIWRPEVPILHQMLLILVPSQQADMSRHVRCDGTDAVDDGAIIQV